MISLIRRLSSHAQVTPNGFWRMQKKDGDTHFYLRHGKQSKRVSVLIKGNYVYFLSLYSITFKAKNLILSFKVMKYFDISI